MKKVYSSLLLVAMFYAANAQHFAVTTDKNNILYLGVENPLSIAVENCPCSQLVVKTNNGSVTGNNCQYMYKGEQNGSAEIILYKKNSSRLKEIGRNYFRVKRIPMPVFKIAGYGGYFRKANTTTLAAQQYVRAELEGFDFNTRCTLDSFYVTIFLGDSCKTKIFFNTSNTLNEAIRDVIRALKTNDIIIFDRIYAKCPDGQRELAPLILTIEN